ncbi:MAG TPA: OsmC family protein, partial [Parvularculaceae bacterium]|nr:OsmC family protein [Parvularculaceae bacterium]
MLDKTKPHVVNGLNVNDLKALIERVAEDPASGATSWKVSSVWKGRTHNRSTVSSFNIGGEEVKREFAIDVDEPEELGGGNKFANPQEYLLAALNSCMMVGYVALCSLEGIRIDSLEIDVQGDIDLRGFFGLDDKVAPGYENLDYTVRIKGDASPEEFEE